MSDKVSIAGEGYVKTDKGWVHEKSKAPANKGLQSLLELAANGQMAPDDDPEEPIYSEKDQSQQKQEARIEAAEEKAEELDKQEEKVDTQQYEVVVIAGTKYVYDTDAGWIDAKNQEASSKRINVTC